MQLAQAFVVTYGRGIHQASSRASNAIARAGTLPTHHNTVLTGCLCETRACLEELLDAFGQRQAAQEAGAASKSDELANTAVTDTAAARLLTPRSMVAKLRRIQIPRMAIELVHCVRLQDSVRPLLLSGLLQKETVVLKSTVKSSHQHFTPAAADDQLLI